MLACSASPRFNAPFNRSCFMIEPVPIERAQRGQARLCSVIETYAPRLLRFLEQRTGSGSDAQDLAQEAYFRLCRVPDPDLIREPESYLFRIASNLAHELRLRRRSQPAVVELDGSLPELAGDDGAFEDLLEDRSSIEALEAILTELPPLYRAVSRAGRSAYRRCRHCRGSVLADAAAVVRRCGAGRDRRRVQSL